MIGLFDNKKYVSIAKKYSSRYKSNLPFPNIQIKNFLDEKIAKKLEKNFPSYKDSNAWTSHKGHNDHKNSTFKKAQNDERKFPKVIREFIRETSSRQFILFLESISGISGLIPDPYIIGGGLHIAKNGGYLNIHTDFNWQHKLQLHRRLNVLIYLSSNWKEQFKGSLELWNSSRKKKVKDYVPEFNSCVIFNTTGKSFHGHPEKIKSSKEIFRKVINLYYYTSTRPKNEIYNPTFTVYGTIKRGKINPSKFKISNSPFCNNLLKNYKKFK